MIYNYCHLCSYPYKSPKHCPPYQLPSRGTWAKCRVERLILDPPSLQPGPERMSSQAVDLTHPQCSASAAAAPLSPASAHVTSMCLPPAPVPERP